MQHMLALDSSNSIVLFLPKHLQPLHSCTVAVAVAITICRLCNEEVDCPVLLSSFFVGDCGKLLPDYRDVAGLSPPASYFAPAPPPAAPTLPARLT